MRFLNNKGISGGVWILGIIVLLLFASQSGFNLGSIFGGSTPGMPPGTPTPACASTSETLTAKGFEKWTSNTIPNTRVWLGGVDQGNRTDGQTSTVAIGNKVDVVYAFDSADLFSDYATFTMPCASVNTGNPEFGKGAEQVLRMDNNPGTNGQWTWINSDDGNQNDGTSNCTVGSAGSCNVKMTLQFQNKKSFNPVRVAKTLPNGQAINPNVLIAVQYDQAAYDSATTKWVEGFQTVPAPSWLTVTNTSYTMRVYALPPCSRDQETCTIEATWAINAKSGVNPTAAGSGTAGAEQGFDFNFTIIPQDMDLKTTGTSPNDIFFGIEDNLGARFGKLDSPGKTASARVRVD